VRVLQLEQVQLIVHKGGLLHLPYSPKGGEKPMVVVSVIPTGFCGRELQDSECKYCALKKKCKSPERAMALWVPYTQKA